MQENKLGDNYLIMSILEQYIFYYVIIGTRLAKLFQIAHDINYQYLFSKYSKIQGGQELLTGGQE